MYRACFFLLLAGLTACAQPAADPVSPAASLEAELQALLAEHPDALVGIAVHDEATGTLVEINGDSLMHAASTMKVPVMVEVFRQAEDGRLHLHDSVLVKNEFRSIVDGSRYAIEDDSDDAIYTRLGQPMTVRDLVYQMITVSSNLATNLLIDLVSATAVQETMETMGTRQMQVLRGVEDIKAFEQGLSNVTTASDLALVLDKIRRREAVSPAASDSMLAILHDQQFKSMIPAGLPEDTRVAHKTGNITGINHDAAIVYPAQGTPYTLVILTRGFASSRDASAFGSRIAETVHTALRGARAEE